MAAAGRPCAGPASVQTEKGELGRAGWKKEIMGNGPREDETENAARAGKLIIDFGPVQMKRLRFKLLIPRVYDLK
jgi:hypothetical protein